MFQSTGAPRRGALSFLLGIGLVLVIGVAITSFYPQQDVVLLRIEEKAYGIYPTTDSSTIVYSFRHSVTKTIVEEYIDVVPPSFVLTHTRMQSFGAGLPTELGESFVLEDDWYVLALNRTYPSLSFRVTGFTEQVLRIAKDVVPFSLFNEGDVVSLEIVRRPIIWLRLRGVMK